MSKLKKRFVVIAVCLMAVCAIAAPMIAAAVSDYGDLEQFYSSNKVILQRHAHSRVLMRLPIIRQSRRKRTGVACVQSVLRYAKYEFDIREDNLSDALDADPDEMHDIKWDKIVGYLNAVRLDEKDIQYFRAEKREKMTVDDLIKELDKGHPVICAIQAWDWDENGEYSMDLDYSIEEESGAWVLAVGHSDDSIFFMDPMTAGNYTYIPKHKLVERWHDYYIDEYNQRQALIRCGIVVELCGDEEPDGERYKDAFYGLM